jgi:hypothetical protein
MIFFWFFPGPPPVSCSTPLGGPLPCRSNAAARGAHLEQGNSPLLNFSPFHRTGLCKAQSLRVRIFVSQHDVRTNVLPVKAAFPGSNLLLTSQRPESVVRCNEPIALPHLCAAPHRKGRFHAGVMRLREEHMWSRARTHCLISHPSTGRRFQG